MSSIRWSVPPHVRLEETGDAILILDATRGGVHRLVGPSAVVIRAAMSPEGADGLTGEELAAAEALEAEGLLVRSGGREISRRTALTAGAAAALGITTLMLPAAAVAASVEPLEPDLTETIGGDPYSFWVFASPGTTTFVADGVPSGDEVDVLVVGGGGGGAGGALVTRLNTAALAGPTTEIRRGHGGGGGGGGGVMEVTLPISGGVEVIVGSGGTGGSAGSSSADPDEVFPFPDNSITWQVYLGQNGAAGMESEFGSVKAGGGSGGEAAGTPAAPASAFLVSVDWSITEAPGGGGGTPGSGGDGGDGDGDDGQDGETPEDWFDQSGGGVGGVSGGGGGGVAPDTGDGGDGRDGGGDGGEKGAAGKPGAMNRGGGGGGGGGSENDRPATAGGDGGDGIVIVRYPSIP